MSILLSPLLKQAGFRHGFGTRRTASEEYPERVHILKQVHGERIVILSEGLRAEGEGRSKNTNFVFREIPIEPFRFDEGDAMITDIPGVSIGIRTADCLPLLVADGTSGTVAAIHCGWRSLVLGLAGKATDALIDLAGSEPSRCVAALGPCIGPCCYEVGEDVLRTFTESGYDTPGSFDIKGGGLRMNLGNAAGSQLVASGILPENIDRINGCTMCDREMFWSYRKGDETDRMISWITAN